MYIAIIILCRVPTVKSNNNTSIIKLYYFKASAIDVI